MPRIRARMLRMGSRMNLPGACAPVLSQDLDSTLRALQFYSTGALWPLQAAHRRQRPLQCSGEGAGRHRVRTHCGATSRTGPGAARPPGGRTCALLIMWPRDVPSTRVRRHCRIFGVKPRCRKYVSREGGLPSSLPGAVVLLALRPCEVAGVRFVGASIFLATSASAGLSQIAQNL